MHNNRTNMAASRKYWFYIRKGIFQVFFPIFLGLLTFSDFANQSTNKNSLGAYNKMYFYTSGLLFIYAQVAVVLNFIFATCSEDVIFRKMVDLQNSSSELMITSTTNISDGHSIITIKKIFKLRYSCRKIFRFIDKLCWLLGIDSPVLIPYDVIIRLTNYKSDIVGENEQQLLHTTLANLLTYDPVKINGIGLKNYSAGGASMEYTSNRPLLPTIVISKLDQSIGEMQEKIFNKQMDIYSNV